MADSKHAIERVGITLEECLLHFSNGDETQTLVVRITVKVMRVSFPNVESYELHQVRIVELLTVCLPINEQEAIAFCNNPAISGKQFPNDPDIQQYREIARMAKQKVKRRFEFLKFEAYGNPDLLPSSPAAQPTDSMNSIIERVNLMNLEKSKTKKITTSVRKEAVMKADDESVDESVEEVVAIPASRLTPVIRGVSTETRLDDSSDDDSVFSLTVPNATPSVSRLLLHIAELEDEVENLKKQLRDECSRHICFRCGL